MKRTPSATMTIDTLAAEIRRQAEYHAAQEYPFPELTVRVEPNQPDGRLGWLQIASDAAIVEVHAEWGLARVFRLTTAGNLLLVESAAEWSAAMHALAPFLPDAAAADQRHEDEFTYQQETAFQPTR